MSKLSACPFCGGKPSIHGNFEYGFLIAHLCANGTNSFRYASNTESDAEAMWNRRATPPAPEAVPERGGQEIVEALGKHLIKLSVGSCTCGVKSPDIMWHDAGCTYRLAQEALENVEALQSALVEAPSRAAVRAEALEEAAVAVEKRASEIGRADCCGHGVGGYTSPPECCGDPNYMISDRDAAQAIRALKPLPAPPKLQGGK